MTYQIISDETVACWTNSMLNRDVLGCERVGKQHVVPLESSRGPLFSKKCRDKDWITLVHSRLPHTGFVAPHLREVVMLWNSTSYSAVISLWAIVLLHWRDVASLHGWQFYMKQLNLHKWNPNGAFCSKGNLYNEVQIATSCAFVSTCSHVSFCGFVTLW